MSLIIGIEYCKLDNNGRFKLPIAIKKQLQGEDCRFVIKPSIYADCLELWTYASFEAEIERLQKELNPYSIEDRKLLRVLSAGNIVEMDTSDRLVIPNEQRIRLKSSKDLVIQSYGNFMEIWDHDTYCRINDNVDGYAEKIDERLGRVANEPEK
jgi:MraZ protein